MSPPETPLPSPSPTATDPAPASDDPALVFADTFIAPVWLEGPVAAGIKASYDHGSYRLAGPAIDLPVYVAAPVEAVAGALDVRADLGLGVRDGGGGIFLAAGDTKFGAFVFPDGRVLLVRDSPGSVDVLGQARVGGMGGPVSLELRTDGGRLTVAVDGEAVLSAVQPVRPEEIGLAAWFQEGASAIRVTEFSASRL